MARSGLYKSDVQKARDALIAQGTNPSVDAVRVALGNTGSKTTIHKYLKELEAEDGGAGGKRASISDALQDLVERLAARLQEEAEEAITALRVEYDTKAAAHMISLQAAQTENSQLRARVVELETALKKQGAVLVASQADYQSESTMRQVAKQQVTDIMQRLAENEAHRQSLEEKHQHARQALEHYRQSTKEQREADIRRHEQQIQQIQAEISHTKQSLHEQLTQNRKLEQKIDTLQALHAHAADAERQLANKIAETESLAEEIIHINNQIAPLEEKVRELELLLVQANAKVQVQEQIGEQLRAYVDKIAANQTAQ
jgi:chromosome segregation ATPase